MCCFDIIESVQSCFYTVVGCACFLLIGGPVLIIVGAMMLTNNIGGDIADFKKAVETFDNTPINSWTGTINGVDVTRRQVNLNVKGVSGAESVFVEAVVPSPYPDSQSLPVDVRVRTVTPFSRNVSLLTDKKSTYYCSSSDCRTSIYGCSCEKALRRFMDACTSSHGVFTPLAHNCIRGSHCGECKKTLYLSVLYLVAEEVSKGQYREDKRLQSAKYDFTNFANDYQQTPPTNIAVRLYSNKDPFISLQRLTKGRDYFLEMRNPAIAMIVIGVILTLLEVCVCVALICYCMRKKNASSTPEAPQLPAESGYSYSQPLPPPQQGYAYGQPVVPPTYPAYTNGETPPPTQQGYAYYQPPPPTQQGYAYSPPPPPTQQGYAYTQLPPPTQQGYTYVPPPPPKQRGCTNSKIPPPTQQGYTYVQPPPPTYPASTYGQPKPFYS